jgi:hypothetical protein
MGLQEPFDTPAQLDIVATGPVEVSNPLLVRRDLEGVAEDILEFSFASIHDITS